MLILIIHMVSAELVPYICNHLTLTIRGRAKVEAVNILRLVYYSLDEAQSVLVT